MALCKQEKPKFELQGPAVGTLARGLADFRNHYEDQRTYEEVQELQEECKVIQGGINHLLEVNEWEKSRNDLVDKKEQSNARIAAFREVRNQGYDNENMQQLNEEIKTKLGSNLDNVHDHEILFGEEEPVVHDEDDEGNKKTIVKKNKVSVHHHGQQHAKMSKREFLRQFKELIAKTVSAIVENIESKDKIEQININIDEGEDNPENYLIEEMLRLYKK